MNTVVSPWGVLQWVGPLTPSTKVLVDGVEHLASYLATQTNGAILAWLHD